MKLNILNWKVVASTIPSRSSHFFIISVILYLSIAVFSINKPLTLDQAIPISSNAVAIADYGWRELGNTALEYEISHTPLHTHLLALSYKAFGVTTFSGRLIGVLCFVGVLFMIIQLSKDLFPERKGVIVGGTAALLYSINPFTVQQSLLVDQETTILPLTMLIFIYYLYRNDFKVSIRPVTSLGALFALSIWAKEFSPFFMLIALWPFAWLYRGFRDATVLTFGIGIIGVSLFVATWGLYCIITGVSIMSFVEFSIINKALSPDFHNIRSIAALVHAYEKTNIMITPAFTALLIMAAATRIKLLFSSQGGQPLVQRTDYIWFYIIVFWAITNLHMYTYQRYQYPMYSIAVIPIAELLYVLLTNATRKHVIITAVLGTGTAMALALLLPYTHIADTYEYIVVWVVVPLVICALGIVAIQIPFCSRQYLGLTALCFFIATNLSVGIQQTKAYTTAVSWHEYGEEGFMETLEYLRANVGDTVPIIRKDLAYYLTIDQPEHKYKWIYNKLFRYDEKTINEEISRDDVRFIVLDNTTKRDVAAKMINSEYSLARKFGHFEVFEKRSFR